MPPASSKKGGAPKTGNRDRRSSSRHSTPVSALTESSTAPPTPLPATPTTSAPPAPSSNTMPTAPAVPAVPKESAYLHTPTSAIITSDPSIEVLISGTSAKNSDPPTAKELHGLHDKIRDTVNKFMGKRGEVCDRSMRQLVQRRKERAQEERELELQRVESQRVEREQAAVKKEAEREKVKKEKGLSRKRSREEMEVESEESEERRVRRESLPSVGAHGLARQDGVGVHEGAPPPLSPPVQPGTVQTDPMDTAASPSDSDDARPRSDPPSTVPLYERAFGKDPTKFDDPTIYDIRPLTPDMTDDERRNILNVSHWPESDLRELTAGDPPDADFSNAKPATQVNFTTFQTYVEPYIRAFTEEDVAFLKERGDRLTPYVIPQRGAKGYRDVWAAEDGLTGIEPPAKTETNPNEARGSMDDLDDSTAETDEISMGPVMNRLLSLTRPAPNGNTAKKPSAAEDEADANGDVSMINGFDDTATQDPSQAGAGAADEQLHTRPATYLPPDAPRPAQLPQLDYESMDQRALQELRYIGFLSPTDTPAFDAHMDDEVAARLRTLQHELRRVSRTNNVRKARVLELTEERMAMQEYSNIADDLDNQVNAAYLKRNRSLSKPAKKSGSSAASAARAGAKGVAASVGGGAGGRGVSDGVRALMQKRRDWVDMVGPVVGFGRAEIVGEGETVFGEEVLRRGEGVEREAEVGEVGEGE